MNKVKLPKPLARLPKYWSRKPIRYFILLHLGVLLLISHAILSYRQPVEQAVLLAHKKYWFWLATGMLALTLISWYIRWMVARDIRRLPMPETHGLRFVLQVVLVMILPIFILYQAIHGIFYLLGMDIRASGYIEHEFMWLCAFMLLCYAWWSYFFLTRENKRLRKRIAYGHRQSRRHQEAERQQRFDDFIHENFMVWTEKNKEYGVSYGGDIKPVHWSDPQEWQQILADRYIRINRWVYICEDAIGSVNSSSEKLELRHREKRAYAKIKSNQGMYAYFEEKVGGRHGILTFSKSYMQDAEARGKYFDH